MKKYSGFIEFPVTKLELTDIKSSLPLPKHKKLDIVLDYIDIDTLPYRDTAPHHLRENTKRIVARAEDRDYDQILLTGGIFPHPMEKNGSYLAPDKILDVTEHRHSSLHTGFVSYSVSLDQLKLSDYKSRLGTNKTIFMVKVTGAVPPLADDKHSEMEYSQIGGSPVEDVIAIRELSTHICGSKDNFKFTFKNSSIYILRSFIESYPWTLEKIIDTYLEKDREKCIIPFEVQEILTSLPRHKFTPPASPALSRFQPLFKRACEYVYEKYLSKDYQKPIVAADYPHLIPTESIYYGLRQINRPMHGLASALRLIAFAKASLIFFRAKGKNTDFYRKITDELFQKSTIAILFLLVGWQNALVYQDAQGHADYNKRSAEAFKDFISSDIEKNLFTKTDIEILYHAILSAGIPGKQSHPIDFIMDAALKLDLGRCYPSEKLKEKVASIAEEVGDLLLDVLLEYAYQCRVATGDKSLERNNLYNDDFFIKSSIDAEYCLARINSVPSPDPYADFTPKKRDDAKPTVLVKSPDVDLKEIAPPKSPQDSGYGSIPLFNRVKSHERTELQLPSQPEKTLRKKCNIL